VALVFTIPGKTFLAGEYLALQEGPTLVFMSQPYFELQAKIGTGHLHGIHPESPAGLFIKQHPEVFAKYDLTFQDPYLGAGGFGASTAQFLAAYAMSLTPEQTHQDMEKLFDLKHLLESYYQVAWKGEGQRPSGADLIGQLRGAYTFFEKRRSSVAVSTWPFANLDFHIVHTGNKVATHEHLKSLAAFDAAGLESAFTLIRQAFDKQLENDLIQGIRIYANALQALGFTCEPTLKLLSEVRELPGVLAAKGCGALGADVILVLTRKGNSSALQDLCHHKGLKIMAERKDMATGLQMQVKENL
jgi:mevalonate kinase